MDSTAANRRVFGPRSLVEGRRATCASALVSVTLIAGCAGAPPAPAPAIGQERSLENVFALAPAGATCLVHPEGDTESSATIPVLVDEDGVARWQAVRPRAKGDVERLVLDCTDHDNGGARSSRLIDLRDTATFTSPALAANAVPTARLRPALAGRPEAYSDAELIAAGYGIRPDPAANPAGYARWLEAARQPARRLRGRSLSLHPAAPASGLSNAPQSGSPILATSPPWAGAVMTGATGLPLPPGTAFYAISEATFNVPWPIPGGDRTDTTSIAVWNGVGGFQAPAGLIQGGVQIFTTPTTSSIIMFREYCCGSPVSNNYSATFTPVAGDRILSQQWYCDAKGQLAVNGGYGCSHLTDITQGAVFDCVKPTDPTCPSVPALPGWTVGNSNEFIVELSAPAFTPFTPAIQMSGSAGITSASSTGSVGHWDDFASDPTVWELGDFTNSSTRLNVSLTLPDTVNFSISCVPITSCVGRCGGISNGCGGTLACPACNRCGTPQQCCIQEGGRWVNNRCIFN